MPRPQRAHHIVERTPTFAKREVERERDERSLPVVADARIRRVLVLTIKLDPGIEARISDALQTTTRCTQDAGDRAREQLQVTRLVDQRRPDERQIVVVRRESLERPQLARVV